MRYIPPVLCLAVAAFVSLLPADAQCHRVYPQVVQTYTPTYQTHQAYQTHAAAATYAYTPTFYPAFAIGYVPQFGDTLKEQVLALKVEVRDLQIQQLRAQVTSSQPQQIPPQAGQPSIPKAEGNVANQAPNGPLSQVLVSKCASCHADNRAQASGGGFVLLRQGVPIPLSAEQRLNVLRQISLGQMPKGGKLSDQEFEAIARGL